MGKLAVTSLVVFGLLAPAAQAAPPPNDGRADAQVLTVPSTVRGTTVDATTEEGEPISSCASSSHSVWYSIAPSAARDLVIELDAAGDLDAVVEVYRRTRSQLASVTCGQTDRRGRLTLDFSQARNADLLVKVGQRDNSSSDAFSLRVVAPDTPERPPGRALGRSGASASVDRIANPDDAYGVSMHAGTTYRVHLVSRERCVTASLYPPGTGSFEDGSPVRNFDCDAYFIYTPGPGEGGRYSIQVRAPRSRRGALPYHVQVARAGEDDTAPGTPLANDVRVRGSLRGSAADVVDLYRFDVRRPSILDLRLRAGASSPFNLQLVGEGGRRIRCACGARCAAAAPTWSTSTASTCAGRASSTCGCGRVRAARSTSSSSARAGAGSAARAAAREASSCACGSGPGATSPRSGRAAARTGATRCRG